MTITPEQIAEISSQLSVDLSLQTDDRLIELCLLYRAAPSALPTFTDALKAEITRRFTAAKIASNDVMFSVINNLSNQFNPELQYKEKIYSFVNAADRDLWLTQNVTFFEQLIEIPERIEWVANNSDVMTALALNTNAMLMVAASATAMAAILSSTIAINVVVSSSIALSKIVMSTPARNALMTNNTVFQSVRQQIYTTVSAAWVKKSGVNQEANIDSLMTNINSAIASPSGFVFGSLGHPGLTYTSGKTEAKHPNGTIANIAGTSAKPSTLANLDVVTFNGAIFTARNNYAHGYAELWSPT